MNVIRRKLAIVTGAATDMGLELGRLCAQLGFDLIIAADEPKIHDAARELGLMGVTCRPVQCDLSSNSGFAALMAAIASGERPVDFLFANTDCGLGHGILYEDLDKAMRAIQSSLDGTLRMIFAVAADMRSRGQGCILITSTHSGLMSGSFQALYNGSKTFLDSFCVALGNELKGSGVTVTSLLPDATPIDLFERSTVPRTRFESLAPQAQIISPASATRH